MLKLFFFPVIRIYTDTWQQKIVQWTGKAAFMLSAYFTVCRGE
jgi:hypothetical protein